MMNDTNQLNDKLPLDKNKLDRMKFKIIKLEKDNLLTNKFTRNQMLEEISKIIIEEADKCF